MHTTDDGTPISNEAAAAREAADAAIHTMNELYTRAAAGEEVSVAELDGARAAIDEAESRYKRLLVADLLDPPTGSPQL